MMKNCLILLILFPAISIIAFSSCKKEESCETDYRTTIIGNYQGQYEILDDTYLQPIWPYNTSVGYTADSELFILGWSEIEDTIYLELDCSEIIVPSQNFSGEQYSAGGALIYTFDYNMTGQGNVDSDSINIKINNHSNIPNNNPPSIQISLEKY